MSSEEKAKSDKRNRDTPPFSFRFVNAKLKRMMELSAKSNHRTLAAEINIALERYVG